MIQKIYDHTMSWSKIMIIKQELLEDIIEPIMT